MSQNPSKVRDTLLRDLNKEQVEAVCSESRRLLVVAGAGSGKTEVMARRVAWWVRVDGVSKDEIIAFTFTESAAEELKFRIRSWLEKTADPDDDARLGGMYIGTIHGFCLATLRELAPSDFYMYDVVDEAGRMSLIEQGYHGLLALNAFQSVAGLGKFQSIDLFLRGYDLLNEYDLLDVTLSDDPVPTQVSQDWEWCKNARLNTDVGETNLAKAFAVSAARYYSYLRARRFLDFSTIQSELTSRLRTDASFQIEFSKAWSRLVVDEVQDINPIQNKLIRAIVGEEGFLTAVGDHRQAVYSFRGGRVDLMGSLYEELEGSTDGHVLNLPANYRSTPRIIDLANRWSETIVETAGMANPSMEHQRETRTDRSNCHVAKIHFQSREDEASWIADTIKSLVQTDEGTGAFHDESHGSRGLKLANIAVLVRSGTDIRTYQEALRARGIDAVVRGGPDLFSQPEILLFLSALGVCSGVMEFYGNQNDSRSMPARVLKILGVGPNTSGIIPAAISKLRQRGMNIPSDTEGRMDLLCKAIKHRLGSDEPQPENISQLKCNPECRRWLSRNQKPRRVFPQTLFYWLLREAGIYGWGVDEATLYHIGQLSSLIKDIETAGWTPAESMKWQLIALLNWGAGSARAVESPLIAKPDAVTVTTIHSAKGLEFSAVFVADVCARRFPNIRARTTVKVPFDCGSEGYINPAPLSDNHNYDDERRLMYVALTRAERYLFVSANGSSDSKFFKEIGRIVNDVGGVVTTDELDIAESLDYHPSSFGRVDRLATSFSDLRYFLECPHDFYLRNVLGFAPTIGQEFGYGRGLHNLLRSIHSDPHFWASIASDRTQLKLETEKLLSQGMFYLRYTVGEPLENLQRRAIEGIADYVQFYATELANLDFEPEKEFETLIAEENLLINGTIDVVRLDDPPRVSIVDFKSGDGESETGSGLNGKLMALQIGVYGLAAKEELEYEPQHGMIRYIGQRDPSLRQIDVDLDDRQLVKVREEIVQTGRSIQKREFHKGPTTRVRNRCNECDFLDICSKDEAAMSRRGND